MLSSLHLLSSKRDIARLSAVDIWSEISCIWLRSFSAFSVHTSAASQSMRFGWYLLLRRFLAVSNVLHAISESDPHELIFCTVFGRSIFMRWRGHCRRSEFYNRHVVRFRSMGRLIVSYFFRI